MGLGIPALGKLVQVENSALHEPLASSYSGVDARAPGLVVLVRLLRVLLHVLREDRCLSASTRIAACQRVRGRARTVIRCGTSVAVPGLLFLWYRWNTLMESSISTDVPALKQKSKPRFCGIGGVHQR